MPDGNQQLVVALSSIAASRPAPGGQLLDQVGSGDADGLGHELHRKAAGGGDGNCQPGFFPRSRRQRFFKDLDLEGLAPEQPFELADALLQLRGTADGDDLLVGLDRDLAPPRSSSAFNRTAGSATRHADGQPRTPSMRFELSE